MAAEPAKVKSLNKPVDTAIATLLFEKNTSDCFSIFENITVEGAPAPDFVARIKERVSLSAVLMRMDAERSTEPSDSNVVGRDILKDIQNTNFDLYLAIIKVHKFFIMSVREIKRLNDDLDAKKQAKKIEEFQKISEDILKHIKEDHADLYSSFERLIGKPHSFFKAHQAFIDIVQKAITETQEKIETIKNNIMSDPQALENIKTAICDESINAGGEAPQGDELSIAIQKRVIENAKACAYEELKQYQAQTKSIVLDRQEEFKHYNKVVGKIKEVIKTKFKCDEQTVEKFYTIFSEYIRTTDYTAGLSHESKAIELAESSQTISTNKTEDEIELEEYNNTVEEIKKFIGKNVEKLREAGSRGKGMEAEDAARQEEAEKAAIQKDAESNYMNFSIYIRTFGHAPLSKHHEVQEYYDALESSDKKKFQLSIFNEILILASKDICDFFHRTSSSDKQQLPQEPSLNDPNIFLDKSRLFVTFLRHFVYYYPYSNIEYNSENKRVLPGQMAAIHVALSREDIVSLTDYKEVFFFITKTLENLFGTPSEGDEVKTICQQLLSYIFTFLGDYIYKLPQEMRNEFHQLFGMLGVLKRDLQRKPSPTSEGKTTTEAKASTVAKPGNRFSAPGNTMSANERGGITGSPRDDQISSFSTYPATENIAAKSSGKASPSLSSAELGAGFFSGWSATLSSLSSLFGESSASTEISVVDTPAVSKITLVSIKDPNNPWKHFPETINADNSIYLSVTEDAIFYQNKLGKFKLERQEIELKKLFLDDHQMTNLPLYNQVNQAVISTFNSIKNHQDSDSSTVALEDTFILNLLETLVAAHQRSISPRKEITQEKGKPAEEPVKEQEITPSRAPAINRRLMTTAPLPPSKNVAGPLSQPTVPLSTEGEGSLPLEPAQSSAIVKRRLTATTKTDDSLSPSTAQGSQRPAPLSILTRAPAPPPPPRKASTSAEPPQNSNAPPPRRPAPGAATFVSEQKSTSAQSRNDRRTGPAAPSPVSLTAGSSSTAAKPLPLPRDSEDNDDNKLQSETVKPLLPAATTKVAPRKGRPLPTPQVKAPAAPSSSSAPRTGRPLPTPQVEAPAAPSGSSAPRTDRPLPTPPAGRGRGQPGSSGLFKPENGSGEAFKRPLPQTPPQSGEDNGYKQPKPPGAQ